MLDRLLERQKKIENQIGPIKAREEAKKALEKAKADYAKIRKGKKK